MNGSGKNRDANVTAGSTRLKSKDAHSEPEVSPEVQKRVQKLFSFSFWP